MGRHLNLPGSFPIIGRVALGLILAVLLAGGAWAGEAFEVPRPGRVFQFPRDHGAHPEYKTEWWYYVGHLTGRFRGVFRLPAHLLPGGLRNRRHPTSRPVRPGRLNTVYFAHLALTDPARRTFAFREKAGRGALGLSGAAAGPMRVWIDDWQAELQGEEFHLQAQDRGLGLDLVLKPLKPPALHGEGGYSRKSAKLRCGQLLLFPAPAGHPGDHLTVDGRTLAGNRHELDGPRVFQPAPWPRIWWAGTGSACNWPTAGR